MKRAFFWFLGLAAAAVLLVVIRLPGARRETGRQSVARGTAAGVAAKRTAPGRMWKIMAGSNGTVRPVPLAAQVTSSVSAPEVTGTARRDREPGAIPGEHIFGFYSSADMAEFVRLARSFGIDVIRELSFGNAVRVRVKGAEQLRRLLAEGPLPVNSGRNTYARVPDPSPREPRPPETGYVGFGRHGLRWLGVAEADVSWGDGVTVAVLDTGIGTHAAMASASISRINVLPDGQPDSSGFHGTAVASIIAGDSRDVPGVAPRCSLLGVRVASDEGVGDAFTLAEGIVTAVDHGANIINLCLGTRTDSFILRQAVEYAIENGVALVAAAGNDATEGLLYPARYEGVTAVSAVDAAGRHLYFANRGEEVDLAAPGVAVNAAAPGDSVAPFSGTSAAVPFVSGALAVLVSENNELTPVAATDILKLHSNDAGAPGADEEYGDGILNLERALAYDVEGIHDVAVASPYLVGAGDSDADTVVLYAENRGTVPLNRIDMRVQIAGEEHTVSFYNVAVGQSVSRSFTLPSLVGNEAGVEVAYSASAVGVADARPGNNSARAILVPADDAPSGD